MYQLYLDGGDLTGGVLNLGGTTKAIDMTLRSPFEDFDYSDVIGQLDVVGVTVTVNAI